MVVPVDDADGEAPGAEPDAATEADGDAADLTWCARLAALLGGIVTTTGDAAMAIPDWPHEAAPDVPQLAEAADEPAACPAGVPEERTPRVR